MTDAAAATLPLWLEIIVAVLVLCGAGLALLGSTGLLRLPTFFERVHAPSIIATLGCWLIMHGTVLYFSVADRSLALHALLIAVFVAISVPIMSIFLMRAALFRARQMGYPAVPPTLSLPKPDEDAATDSAADTTPHPKPGAMPGAATAVHAVKAPQA